MGGVSKTAFFGNTRFETTSPRTRPRNATEFKRSAAPFRGLFWSTSGPRLTHFGEQLRFFAVASSALARQRRDAGNPHGIQAVSGALSGPFLEHIWPTFGSLRRAASSRCFRFWRPGSPGARRCEIQRDSSSQRRPFRGLSGALLGHIWSTLANNVVSSSSLLAPWFAPKGLRTASPHEREQRSETQRNSSGPRRSLGAFLEHLWPTFGPSFGNNFVF